MAISDSISRAEKTPSQPLRWRKIGFVIWLILFALLLLAHWFPIRFGALRFALVADAMTLWLLALWLFWPYKTARGVLVLGLIAPLIIILAPDKPQNPQELRAQYVRALQSYEGTPYIWGGESKRGIDCSGLMRCAFIDANIAQGRSTLNASAIRAAFSMWWNDASAKAIKEEYRGDTRLLFVSPSINHITKNQLEYSALEPGDIAVTASGVHVLAYIGNQTWIEADPNELQGNCVIKVQTPTKNAWFNTPVHIMRWRHLELKPND